METNNYTMLIAGGKYPDNYKRVTILIRSTSIECAYEAARRWADVSIPDWIHIGYSPDAPFIDDMNPVIPLKVKQPWSRYHSRK